MTAVPPPPPPGAAPPAAAPAAQAVAEAVLAVPPSPEVAAKLAALRQLQAMVKAMDGQLARLATPAGEVTVRLQLPVQAGTQLLLQVVPQPRLAAAATPPAPGQAPPPALPLLRVVAVDGRPPALMLRAAATPPQAAVGTVVQTAATPLPAQAAETAAVTRTPAPPAAVTATLLRPAAPAAGQPPALPPGTVLPVRILSVTPQPPTAPAVPAAPQTVAPAPSAPPPSATAPSTTAPSTTAQPPAPGFATTAPSTPPLPASAPPPPQAPGQQLAGTVAPNSHAGQPLLQTPIGLVALGGAAALPPGARVVLQLAGPPQPPAPAAALPAAAPPAPGGFSGLAQAVAVLRQADPAAAARLVADLPQPGPRLAAGMMLFAAALRTEAAAAALVEGAVQALDRAGRRDAARRVVQDIGEAMPKSRATPAGEWRAASLPMLLQGGTVEPVRLWLRRPEWDEDEDENAAGGGEGEGAGGRGQRFVVDVTFSAFGRFQMDSLIRREARRYDAAFRTERALPDPVRQEIAAIFRRCCDGLGLAGHAMFKAGEPFFEPPAEAPPAPGILA